MGITINKKLADKCGRGNWKLRSAFWIVLLLTVIGVTGCASIVKIPPFDPEAYERDIAIRNSALDLMDYGVKDYAGYQADVEKLQKAMETAYQNELKRQDNDITIRMWVVLKSPEQDLLGGFLKRWRDERTLSKEYIEAMKSNPDLEGSISWAFDRLIKWEEYKQPGFKEEREALLMELQLWLTVRGINIDE